MTATVFTILISLLFYTLVGIVTFKAVDNRRNDLWNKFIDVHKYTPVFIRRQCQAVMLLFWPIFVMAFLIKEIRENNNAKRNLAKNSRDHSRQK